MKYFAEIYEDNIFRHSVEFITEEERENWLKQFNTEKPFALPSSPEFKVSYNPKIRIKFKNQEPIDLQPYESSIESYIKVKSVEGRFAGNKEFENDRIKYTSGDYFP